MRKFYPTASWVALSRKPERYVTLAQLSVGLFVDQRTGMLFVNFNIGEEYAPNEDKDKFLDWISDAPAELLALLSVLDPSYELRYRDGAAEVSLPVREVTRTDLERVAHFPRSSLLDLHIQRYYSWSDDRETLQRAAVVLEVAEQFKVLYPIYRKVSEEARGK